MAVWIHTDPSHVQAQAFTDPGFENYTVSAGGFIQPTSGPWSFVNDAGVVRPPAPNSSTGPLDTWSATFSPIDGQLYASTYAGGDTIRQSITFADAGDYRVSASAAAPNGSLTIPSVGTVTLGDAEFTFTLGNVAIGSLHGITAGSSWSAFTADFTIATPGSYELGIRNTKAAPYFINYDAFAIQPVPEPTVGQLAVAAGVVVLGAIRWRNRQQKRIPRRE